MAAPRRPTHEVVHPNLHLRVDGALQRMEKGTQIRLSKETAERLRDKVKPIGKKTVDLADPDGGDPAGDE